MTKPDDIPQDVWVDAGIELAGRRIPASDTEVADTIAGWAREIASRAILAERERCAKIAEDFECLGRLLPFASDAENNAAHTGQYEAAERIAAAIRNGSHS